MKIVLTYVALAVAAPAPSAQTVVVHPCETVVLSNGPFDFDEILVEPGGTLRVEFGGPPRIHIARGIRVEGLIDLSGESAKDVKSYLNNALIQKAGGFGGPGAGLGGIGNPMPGSSNAKGGDALEITGHHIHGTAGGGESGYGLSDAVRAAGGGGGALAANQPVNVDPDDPSNLGLIARSGFDGDVHAFGAITHASPPHGGNAGVSAFVDNDQTNDFWGHALDPITHAIVTGELYNVVAGRGGGAGGDAYLSSTFPPWPYTPSFRSGAGGGGGGGSCIIVTPVFEVTGDGAVRCNGGNGAGGANTNGFNRIGGGSGGGSGGMLVLQARLIDLHAASSRCLTALGGRGGPGANDAFHVSGAGGDGGPGIIQLHTTNGLANIRLPSNRTLADMTAPTAHVLLPEPGL